LVWKIRMIISFNYSHIPAITKRGQLWLEWVCVAKHE
jgi:hypothetical protein